MPTAPTSKGIERALALETSGRTGSVAAFRSERGLVEVIAVRTLPADSRSAQSLLPVISQLLKSCSWRAEQLELTCTTTGPGSFTGLRIGVTTAKTLAYAAGAKLVGVHTLSALAAAAGARSQRLWAILDAQRQELFAACFPPEGHDLDGFVPETSVVGIDAWCAQLLPGDLVTGPPLAKLSDRMPPGVEITDSALWQPQAEFVARLGVAANARGETVDPMQLAPQYFRPSAAEEKAKSKSGNSS